MISVIARIILRYIAAVLVARGVMDPTTSIDFMLAPEMVVGVEAVIGLIVGAVTEAWHYLERKLGWGK